MRVLCAGFNLYGLYTNIPDICIETFQNDCDGIDELEISHTYLITKSNDINLRGYINKETHQTKKLNFDEKILQISSSTNHSLFLSENGTIWKLKEEAQDYHVCKLPDITKVEVEFIDKIEKIACGDVINCALSTNGCIYNIPNRLNSVMTNIKDIQCGREHCLLLTNDGFVYSFGGGSRGQLGHGDVEDQSEPTLIEGLSGVHIIKISCGSWHSAAVSSDGDLYIWGWNSNGQLGIKSDVAMMATPYVIELNDNVTEVQCGARHTIILMEENKLYGSGWNKYNQLGIKSEEEHLFGFTHLYDFCSLKVKSLKCGPWNSAIVIDI